jgi:hypothetical protein
MMIEFVVLAVGPKHCDLEVKDLTKGRTIGRVQFDASIHQLETMDITLDEMQLRLNGKEERPLFTQFKVISNKEVPKLSDHSDTFTGRYKKETNETKFKWDPKKS